VGADAAWGWTVWPNPEDRADVRAIRRSVVSVFIKHVAVRGDVLFEVTCWSTLLGLPGLIVTAAVDLRDQPVGSKCSIWGPTAASAPRRCVKLSSWALLGARLDL
jgi:hypothetical protein